jgi:putative transport protein
VSLGLGMVMGVLLGLIPIPIPGVGTVTLGIGGGPLIVALIVGKLRRTGPLLWVMPLPANIVLRNFGLALFLAAVGINAGQPFVRTVAESGLTMLFIGAAVLLTTVLIVLLVGYYLMKIPKMTWSASHPERPAIPPSWCIRPAWRRPSVPTSAMR